MIDGVFEICAECGGEVTVVKHLIDAHMAENDPEEVHLVWFHEKCKMRSEAAISIQDYKSALSISKIDNGEKVLLIPSDGDELMVRWRHTLEKVDMRSFDR